MQRLPLVPPLLLVLALSACGPTAPPASTPPPPSRAAAPAAGLDRVMGQSAPSLIASLGTPALDVREGTARKLQFRSPACVLDTYLYPPAGGGDPKVTWIDARTPTGADFDRASCVASLARIEPPKPARTVPAAARPGRRKR
ncbi:hypothetical protein Q4F19_00255 [Sphingomonas sp. BIUV-7]|uniref:Uncharacterized protein n=1 Tax=Sphingomonas natans TaxID=3063330 RepID=A0ABT8Y3B6_9SPHN|nr:hypothetical protein [Sphingomonas sp. BIUV-7]MDO6412803.1 hypothetical protein [Sphingomonas sp. BIUV-7]